MTGTGLEYNRIMVSVPKKLFKRAVKRNLLKRRIRESYRKQKHNLTVQGGLDVLFMYSTKEILSYEEIYAAVGQIIEKINERGAEEDSDSSVHISDQILSDLHLSIEATMLQVHSHMLAICPRGIQKTRPFQRALPYRQAHPALPSMGRTRIRSGTLNCYERDIQEADSGKESKGEHHSGKEQSEDIHIFLLIKEKRYHQQDKQWHRKHIHEM